jgi:hypothetical protein
MATANLPNDIVALLGEAAAEIAKLDSPGNTVCRRLRDMQMRLQPLTATLGELAKRVDLAPGDVLDAALAIGIHVFWREGKPFRVPSNLRAYLPTEFDFGPIRELEFDITPAVAEQLAAKLDVDVERLTTETSDVTAKRARKFVASEQTPPQVIGKSRSTGTTN